MESFLSPPTNTIVPLGTPADASAGIFYTASDYNPVSGFGMWTEQGTYAWNAGAASGGGGFTASPSGYNGDGMGYSELSLGGSDFEVNLSGGDAQTGLADRG